MKDNIAKGRNMGKGESIFMMALNIKESLKIMKFAGLVSISGMMGKFIKVSEIGIR